MVGGSGGEFERGRTEAALEGTIARMNGDVITQALGGQEALRALGTRVFAILGVRPNVFVHAELAIESSATDVARVCKFNTVRRHVFAQIRQFRKGGRTLFTLDRSKSIDKSKLSYCTKSLLYKLYMIVLNCSERVLII